MSHEIIVTVHEKEQNFVAFCSMYCIQYLCLHKTDACMCLSPGMSVTTCAPVTQLAWKATGTQRSHHGPTGGGDRGSSVSR